MKGTGIVRRMDELGRLVIPSELRDRLNLNKKDPIEIFVEDERIILQKFSNAKACMVTGEISDSNLVMAEGDFVVSPEGAEKLMVDLQAYLEKVKKNKEDRDRN